MTAAIDITTEQRKTLLALLRRFIPGVAVWVYGSRVKWTARPNSDLDLVAFTTPAQRHLVSEIKEAFDESNLPFLVDFHVWDEVPERFHEIIRKEYVVLQEAKQPESISGVASEWKLEPLDKLIDDILDRRGVTPLKLGSGFKDFGHRVISAKLMKGSRINLDADEPRFVDDATYMKWMQTPLLPDDVILTSEAPLGELAYINEELDWCLGQRLFGIRTNKKRLHGRYLFYALKSEQVRHNFLSRATGTTVQGIRQSELRQVLIPFPSNILEQKTIAHILGALDDKIELNRRMNATLEAMARALFQSWFVDFDPVRAKLDAPSPPAPLPLAGEGGRRPGEGAFGLDVATAALFPGHFQDSPLGHIPQGWTAGCIGDVAKNSRRGIQPNDIGVNTPYIALEHMPRRCIALGDWGDSADVASGKSVFYKGEILFGKLRPYFHKVGVAPVDGVCSTDILILSPKSPEWFGFLLGHASSDALVQFTDLASTGTKMPRTNWGDISSFKVALPPEPIVAAFTRVIEPMIERIAANLHQSRTLAALCDTLLPKLLSGELSLPAAMLAAQAGVTGIESKLAETVAESATVQTRRPAP